MTECKNCLFTEENYPQIKLNEDSVCDVCTMNIDLIEKNKINKKESHRIEVINWIKKNKKGKYDCMIGISRGADSTYLVHLTKEWSLNPLLLHVDGGWNSTIAVQNINNLVNQSGFDYETIVMDWNRNQGYSKSI